MPAAQFIHISGYGRKPRPGAKHHETAFGILNEAGRVPSATHHIDAPQPAQLIYGVPPETLRGQVLHLAERARDSSGRRLRSDAALIMAVVASCPELIPTQPDEEYEVRLWHWIPATLCWLQNCFGAQLRSVVLHEDEAHHHLHAVWLPIVREDGQLDWNRHPGRRAAAEAASDGEGKAAQNAAYVRAMKLWQDDYFLEVSQKFGHERKTVARERRARDTHLQIRALEAQVERLTKALAEAGSAVQMMQALALAEEGGTPALKAQAEPEPRSFDQGSKESTGNLVAKRPGDVLQQTFRVLSCETPTSWELEPFPVGSVKRRSPTFAVSEAELTAWKSSLTKDLRGASEIAASIGRALGVLNTLEKGAPIECRAP